MSSFVIPAQQVQLQARLRSPKPEALVGGAAVLCHPHPVYGGTMDNPVIYRSAKGVVEAGFAALTFNFRGVGGSTGVFDNGRGEKEDVRAAMDWLDKKYPGFPLALLGYSFGAWVGLQVGCSDARVRALVGLGLPLGFYSFDFLIGSIKPALYIVGTEDELCPREKLDRLAGLLPPASIVERIEGAGHFFAPQLERVQELIADFFRRLKSDGDLA